MTKTLAAIVAVVTTALAGCAPMCQSPWDYCNAVIGGNGNPNCNFGARYNSYFAPMNGTPATTPIEPTPAEGAPTEADEGPSPAVQEPGELYDAYDSYDSPLPE